MSCKRLQPSHRSSANSLTLVPAGTTEYIAAGYSQAAVPFPQKSEGISTFSERRLQVFPICCYSLAVTAGKRAFRRRALRRPHPARREVTCGDTDMDWPRLGAVLHTTGFWGRSYLGVGRRAASRTWQKLCHREDTGLPWGKPYCGRIHIWDNPKENQAKWTPSPVQGLTGDLGELTPVLGLASDCSAQSDCRGCLEDSTRVHYPGNWTGGETRRSYPRVRGNGAASMTPASSSRSLRLPNTQEETGSTQRCLCSSADVCQRGTVRQRMKGGTGGTARLEIGTPRRRHPLSSGPASVWRQPSLRVRSTYIRNALTGHSNAKAGSASSEGSACRFTTWLQKGVVAL